MGEADKNDVRPAGGGTREARQPRRLACLSGGGLPGLDIHAGMQLALEERGIRFEGFSGTSAGAIVAALLASGNPARTLADVLAGLSDDDVRDERPLWKLRAPWIRYFLGNGKIERLLRDLLQTDPVRRPRIEHALHPLRIHVTEDLTGAAWSLAHGELVPAVLASMAIAGVFPPVALRDVGYPPAECSCSDGGTTNYCAVPEPGACVSTYDEVWLLIAAPPTRYEPTNESIISRLLLNLHLMIEDQIQDAATRTTYSGARVVVIRPSCGADASCLRFRHELIGQARAETLEQLNGLRIPDCGIRITEPAGV